jgi:hypothetical protein
VSSLQARETEMDTAAAVAQIKAVMSAPTVEVACVVLRASGEAQEVVIDQRKVNELLGGAPTVVGGIRSLDVMAVALRDGKGKKATKHKLPDTFDSNIRGDIVLFRSDEDAAPLAFSLKEYSEWVEAGMPDAEVDEEEEEGGEEEEEEEEESDGEAEEANFEELSVPELKKGCAMLGLSTEGSREDLIARLKEACPEEDEDDEDESDEDEDESDEDEDEESGEEEDEETMKERIREHLTSLSVAQLKEACAELGLSKEGAKAELLARLLEHALQSGQAYEEEDGEEEEEEEEEEEAVAPAPMSSKAAGKQKASPPPVKTIAKGSRAKARAA